MRLAAAPASCRTDTRTALWLAAKRGGDSHDTKVAVAGARCVRCGCGAEKSHLEKSMSELFRSLVVEESLCRGLLLDEEELAMPILESYYDSLGLTRTADTDEVKKAFRKLSLKNHPERAMGVSKAEAEVLFSKIAEAYEVLSNPARRAIYDQYGERGLKEGMPDGKGNLKGGKYRFNNNAVEIFAAFFGTQSPFADILGQVGADAPPEFYGELTGMQLPFAKQKAAPVQAQLVVTLAEVYNGAQKTVSYTRKKLTEDGVTADEDVETQLYVEPGWEEGLVATLPDLGDQGVHVLPGDVEIYLVLLPDDLWSRDGTTLLFKHEITLTEALVGKNVEVPTFDDRTLSIPVTKVRARRSHARTSLPPATATRTPCHAQAPRTGATLTRVCTVRHTCP